MTHLPFLTTITILVLVALFSYKHTLRVVKTRPPVDKILTLIRKGSGFTVKLVDDRGRQWPDADYLVYKIKDTVTGRCTYGYRKSPFCCNGNGEACLHGFFEWMNRYEKERVLSLVEKIISKERKSVEAGANKILDDIHKRQRESAIKTYDGR